LNAENIGVAPASQGSASNSADRRDLGLRLNLVALALLAFFAATIFNGALPLRLLDPTWLEGIVQLLLSQAFLPLIALVLLHLAGGTESRKPSSPQTPRSLCPLRFGGGAWLSVTDPPPPRRHLGHPQQA